MKANLIIPVVKLYLAGVDDFALFDRRLTDKVVMSASSFPLLTHNTLDISHSAVRYTVGS
mgnify:CR=1 FL=1